MPTLLSRARGTLYGQVIGDNLGALVEFESAAGIRARYPGGVRELTGGGPFHVIPGQPTDDSEMALALARSLVRCGGFDTDDVRDTYRRWAASNPFDIGNTCASALLPPYEKNTGSKANGALMRVSPIAVAYAGAPEEAARFARIDASLTHPNPYTGDVNATYAAALSAVIADADPREALLAYAGPLQDEVEQFMAEPPESVEERIGFVRHAFHLTCYYAANPGTFEEDVVAAVGMGGDTDTNAAIVGAFLGGTHGVEAIPQRWRAVVDAYEPDATGRPEEYAPHDLAVLVEQLAALTSGSTEKRPNV